MNTLARPSIIALTALTTWCPRARAEEIIGERFEAVCMLRDEIEIEPWLLAVAKRFVMRLQHQLHDALEGRDITADADLAILTGDPCLAEGRHLDRILRCGKAL